jgi:hypothetical protein
LEPTPCIYAGRRASEARKLLIFFPSCESRVKARTAELFAEFMAGLCEELKRVIRDRLGVVDKFTGDGLPASFP